MGSHTLLFTENSDEEELVAELSLGYVLRFLLRRLPLLLLFLLLLLLLLLLHLYYFFIFDYVGLHVRVIVGAYKSDKTTSCFLTWTASHCLGIFPRNFRHEKSPLYPDIFLV